MECPRNHYMHMLQVCLAFLSLAHKCPQALNESSEPSMLTARLMLPSCDPETVNGTRIGVGIPHRLVISPAQFSRLHSAIIS